VLRAAEDPALAAQIGHDIVTASGLTLLGADDKAGVAEIMAAVEELVTNRGGAHGPVRVAFTPDEEIGRGANHFDVARFGASCAVPRSTAAAAASWSTKASRPTRSTVTFKGFNTHRDTRRDAW
jgi:tripeptide aminopeptidase